VPRPPHLSGKKGSFGKAFFELVYSSLAGPQILYQIARALAKDYPQWQGTRSSENPPRYQLASRDGIWRVTLSPSLVSLTASSYGSQDAFHARLDGLVASVVSKFNALKYGRVSLGYTRAIAPSWAQEVSGEVLQEFTQTVRGTLDQSSYEIHLRISPEEAHYVSDARVSAERVAARELWKVVSELDEKGQSVLSVPDLCAVIGSRSSGKTFLLAQVATQADTVGLADERAQLLASKLGGGTFSAADSARLDELTQRVRRLLPRVTERHWQNLEEIASRSDEVKETVRRIRQKHGLSGSP
jgi:hypothetical protein